MNNSYTESGFENNFVDTKGSTQIQMQEEIDLQALEEQERTIRELEDNIVGVNEIYKKLGALVYEQGNTIDSIEASVENTSHYVSEGTSQLSRASHYSVSIRELLINLPISHNSRILESSSEEENHLGADPRSHSDCHHCAAVHAVILQSNNNFLQNLIGSDREMPVSDKSRLARPTSSL